MGKHIYNAIVTGECDQHEFIHTGHACDYECIDECSMFQSLMVFRLTEEEAEELSHCEEIVSLEKQEIAISSSTYPDILRQQQSNFITDDSVTFAEGEIGTDRATTSFYYFSDSIENENPVGRFIDPPENEDNNIPGSYDYWNDGKYVDIVAVEAGLPDYDTDMTIDHPDFLDANGDRRFIPMQWRDYNVNLNSDENNQIAGLKYFDSHAIGVLSTSGGLYSGWCKNASLRVIYINVDPYVSVYGAILEWHNTKPINPETGKRNATIVTGAWGFFGSTINYAILPDYIDQLQAYDSAGNLVTTNRPGASWGNDLTPFVNAGIAPRYVTDGGVSQWMIPWTTQNKISAWEEIGDTWSTYNGIYNFMSLGNGAGVKAGWNQPQWNTQIQIEDQGGGSVPIKYFYQSFSAEQGVSLNYTIIDTTGSAPSVVYPLRNGRDGDTRWCMSVAASQHSDTNTLLDSYSARGPVVDLAANGTSTFNAYPLATDALGFKWGMFGGTSNAAPQVAGVAGVIVSWWYVKYGRYPSFDELKTYMLTNAKSVLQSDSVIDYTNLTGAPSSSNKIYPERYTTPNTYDEVRFANGGFTLTELFGTNPLRVFLPYEVRLDRISQYHNDIHGKLHVDRPVSGQTYPRRRIRLTL